MYPPGEPPFPASALDGRPTTYAVALQFAGPAAAQQAMQTFRTWIETCRAAKTLPGGLRLMDRGFDWTAVPAQPARAEVAELSYRATDDRSDNATFESVGLTVLDHRLMVTVHLFYTDESPYSINADDDEGGFAHPQQALVRAAARRLGA